MEQNAINEMLESLTNGQRRQMADQIDAYGLHDVWADLLAVLAEGGDEAAGLATFADAVISYHRIRNR